jgi:hypothetical protein
MPNRQNKYSIKEKLDKTNAVMWYKKTCREKQLTPDYIYQSITQAYEGLKDSSETTKFRENMVHKFYCSHTQTRTHTHTHKSSPFCSQVEF